MAKKVSQLVAVLAGNLDDTALLEVSDKNLASRKATVAQLRTQIAAGAIAFLSTVGIVGALTLGAPGVAYTMHGANVSGVDTAAGNLTIIAPLSTSNGAVASIIFRNGLLLTTGSTLQTATTNLTLSSTGAAGSQVPLATFAGNVGMGALTATTAALAGVLTLNYTAQDQVNFVGAMTNAHYLRMLNTSGQLYFGIESSAGGQIIAGSTAYDTCLTGKTGLGLSANDGGAVHLRIASTGAVTLSSTLNVGSLGAFASGDKYVIADASGNFHLSALGPLS